MKMEINIQESFPTMKKKEKESIIIKTEINMKDNFTKISDMEKVYTFMKMEINLKEHSLKDQQKERGNSFIMMEIDILAIIKMIKRMDMVFITIEMVQDMMGNSKME